MEVVKSAKQASRGWSVGRRGGPPDLWQRSTLAVACATREHSELQSLLDAVERYLGSQAWELMRADREVVVPGER
jgi:uncharacterized protein YlxP (DUF503 family)